MIVQCLDLTSERGVRRAAIALGVATAAFGILPAIAPGTFARLFGLPLDGGPATQMAIRSVGIRDAVMGVGLLSAAMHRGKYAPWLMARTLVDGGDAVAVSLAFAAGVRNGRLAALGALAFGAAIFDHALWHAARAVATSQPSAVGE
jgi:hypothetical protein